MQSLKQPFTRSFTGGFVATALSVMALGFGCMTASAQQGGNVAPPPSDLEPGVNTSATPPPDDAKPAPKPSAPQSKPATAPARSKVTPSATNAGSDTQTSGGAASRTTGASGAAGGYGVAQGIGPGASATGATRASGSASSAGSAAGRQATTAATGAPKPGAAPTGSGKAHDNLQLDSTQITGNRELPKVLYIVPWKRSDLGDLVGKPVNSLLDEVLTPVDRDVFKRQNRYYDALKPDDPNQAGGATGAAPGGANGAAPGGATGSPDSKH
jgi:hypothetical protein